jgi:N,N'-diacetyllegionaminate synthase
VSSVRLGERSIGAGHPALVIGEVAQTHDGSLGTAHAYIDAIARAGADAVKFQTHIASAESTPAEQFRVPFSKQDSSRYDYWRRMEFTEPQWLGLAEHARERGLVFLSSPFSDAAVDLLSRAGVPAWKVGSGEVTNLPFLSRLAATGKPLLLSTGLSSWADLDRAVAHVRGAPLALFQCTTRYPCPPEELGLNALAELRTRYRCPVGLSDHSATIYAGLAAVTLGANLVEVHVTLSREAFGPDVPASITTAELRQLVDGVRFIERALANPIDKDRSAGDLADLRRVFGKSVVAARDLPAGHRLAPDDLCLKKPGTGIPAADLTRVLGRKLSRAVTADTLLAEADLE